MTRSRFNHNYLLALPRAGLFAPTFLLASISMWFTGDALMGQNEVKLSTPLLSGPGNVASPTSKPSAVFPGNQSAPPSSQNRGDKAPQDRFFFSKPKPAPSTNGPNSDPSQPNRNGSSPTLPRGLNPQTNGTGQPSSNGVGNSALTQPYGNTQIDANRQSPPIAAPNFAPSSQQGVPRNGQLQQGQSSPGQPLFNQLRQNLNRSGLTFPRTQNSRSPVAGSQRQITNQGFDNGNLQPAFNIPSPTQAPGLNQGTRQRPGFPTNRNNGNQNAIQQGKIGVPGSYSSPISGTPQGQAGNVAPNISPSLNSQSNETLPNGVEIVRERYQNGAVRIERQVVLDQDKNYINHGTWKYYLPNGNVTALANFDYGQKSGAWSRWFSPNELTSFRSPAIDQFKTPFLATFQFENDKLNGIWKMSDSANRTIFEIRLLDGKRHSTCTWYLVNGQKLQEIQYDRGLINGSFQKWDVQGQLIEDRKFDQGREIGRITEFHRRGVKKLEYGVMAGKVEAATTDDPWNLKFADEKKQGKDIKNGPVTAWYANGQIQFTGAFDNNLQEGEFTWFYATGQKQAQGQMKQNLRVGEWVWWHDNGMRASIGHYMEGTPTGSWRWWETNGKLARSKSFEKELAPVRNLEQMKNASFRNQ